MGDSGSSVTNRQWHLSPGRFWRDLREGMATREAQLRDALGLDSDGSGDTDRAADGPADGPAGGREPLSPLKARALLDDPAGWRAP